MCFLKSVILLLLLYADYLGGHTMEMLEMMSYLGRHYSSRSYIIAESDKHSEQKVRNFFSYIKFFSQKDRSSDMVCLFVKRLVSNSNSKPYLTSFMCCTFCFFFVYFLFLTCRHFGHHHRIVARINCIRRPFQQQINHHFLSLDLSLNDNFGDFLGSKKVRGGWSG